MQAQLTFYQLNTQWLVLDGLADALNPTQYKNAATITATLYDSSGNAVAGLTNATLSYVNGTNGQYRYLVANTFNPQAGPPYTLKIDGNDGNGNYIHLEMSCAVAVRNY